MSKPTVKLRLLGQGLDQTYEFPEKDWVTVTDEDGKTIFQIEVVEIHDPTPWKWLHRSGQWIKVRW